MKTIRVGLTGADLLSLTYRSACISSNAAIEIYSLSEELNKSSYLPVGKALAQLDPNQNLNLLAQGDKLKLDGLAPISNRFSSIILQSQTSGGQFFVKCRTQETLGRRFKGQIIVLAKAGKIRIILQLPLEEYLHGVLQSEIPGNYHIEAIKAQAIVARTYALNPRINHNLDHCNVCDSYLCCQYFAGLPVKISEHHKLAIEATKDQILTYKDEPILALFSACAGGHTEDYENCFSDPQTNAFPPAPIPYLRGVPEGKLPPRFQPIPNESALKQLWNENKPQTCDAWSPSFKWMLRIPAQSIEAHMHHIVEEMVTSRETASFVTPPPSQIFGEVNSFQVDKRGVAGTAIILSVVTSKGIWQFKKELIIRNLFKNTDLAIHRLNSAKVFFEHVRDQSGLLTSLLVYGLGRGHGVGFQQVGAQGLAMAKMNCQSILEHYFTACQISEI
jgi:stage II sporulation protein D